MIGDKQKDIELFAEAVQLPAGERISFLDRACRDNPGQRQRMEGLLRSNDRAGEFMESPPTASMAEGRSKVASREKPGDWVDRYQLLEQIGEGGCGVVFLAQQHEPVHRQIALKVVKPGMDTKSVIARFEVERQALALMDHANIAKIFDAGETESGRPYFVMELVRGPKITDYCDEHSLTTEERLHLFISICQAVQHAHQKGIIHRDIKPSNILVATSDGTALPVVIDFGIAKATANQVLSDKTVFTNFEMLIGTPAYMSPEQATLNSVDLDTRTDIYSLGVLLYELLTGSTPFEMEEALSVGLDEVRRVIREKEPVRPSTRLGKLTDQDLTIIAERRQAEPPGLIRSVRGDLDWITMKALEKDRTRRYATANGLAVDIHRFLANETISARPPSKLYKFKKTAQRNKLIVAAVTVIALFLIVGLIAVSASLAKERKARRQSEVVTKFLERIFEGAGPLVALGENTTLLKRILDQNVPLLETELADQPLVQAELGTLIGQLYSEMGHSGDGEPMVRKAVQVNRAILGGDSLVTAASLNALGMQFTSQHKNSEAEKAHLEALAIQRRRLGSENPQLVPSLNNLATVYRHEGNLTKAEATAREALRISLKFNTNSMAVADSVRSLALIIGLEGNWVEAEDLARQALERKRKLLPALHPWVASAMEDHAWALNALNRFEEAQALNEQVLAMRQKLLGDDHPDVLRTQNALGQLYRNQGDFKASDAVLRGVLSVQLKLFGDQSQATLETFASLADLLRREGKYPEAESTWRHIVNLWRKKGDIDKKDGLIALRALADVFELQGKWAEAEGVWRESVPLWQKLGGVEERESMYTLRKFAQALEAEHKWPEAEAMHREALSISRKKGDDDPEALNDLGRVISVLMAENKSSDALALITNIATPAFLAKPSSAGVIIQKVNIMARRGQWREAARAATLALEKQPDEHYRYHTLIPLLVMADDRAGYEETCKRMISKFTNSANPFIAERIANDCLLLQGSGLDLTLSDKLADMAIKAGSATDGLPYFQSCKALALYRQRRFSEAIPWAEKAAGSRAKFAQAKAYAVLALARWQLGQQNDARAALQKGDALAPNTSFENGSGDLGESWVAWLMARISLDEATTFIQTATVDSSSTQQ
jgi:serine/threonine protein kinase/tetratricopeptide (TPR) repeat protein